MTADAASRPVSVDANRVNPYVGPRSLGREDGIYDRDREIRELRASIVAHRIVLLYSRSGAGKTSLIEAGLCSELGKLEFHVFPTIRVGYEPPPSDEGARANRYRLSVLSSLEESRPSENNSVPPTSPRSIWTSTSAGSTRRSRIAISASSSTSSKSAGDDGTAKL